jgi:hypothetical protein
MNNKSIFGQVLYRDVVDPYLLSIHDICIILAIQAFQIQMYITFCKMHGNFENVHDLWHTYWAHFNFNINKSNLYFYF